MVHIINLTHHVDVDLGHLAKVLFVRLPHYKIILFPSFHNVFFGRKSLSAAHI